MPCARPTAGIYHLELLVAPAAVAGQGAVQVFVTDHLDQKIATTQASGSISFLNDKTRPQGDNTLKRTQAQLPKRGTQAVVSIAPEPGQTPFQARFTRWLSKPEAAGVHKMPGSAGNAGMPKDAAQQH